MIGSSTQKTVHKQLSTTPYNQDLVLSPIQQKIPRLIRPIQMS